MTVYIALLFLITGLFLGSFYNVVAYRITKGESILFPRSHCPQCKHNLKFWELIPIISFVIQKGKCVKCHAKISWFYPLAEIVCGLLFMTCYLVFGLSLNLIIALTFISMIVIIVLSDYYYMIIEDVILIVFGLLLMIEIFLINGINVLVSSILNGIIAFGVMFLIKLLGDFLFKKESMGGGDIKLMFIFGLVLGFELAITSIFLASIIALPISLIILKQKKDNVLPFGPYLSMGALILYFSQINFSSIFSFIVNLY